MISRNRRGSSARSENSSAGSAAKVLKSVRETSPKINAIGTEAGCAPPCPGNGTSNGLKKTRARPNGICGANATVMRHDGIQRTNRRNRGLLAMPIGVCGGEQTRLRRERGMKIVPQTGRIATANATANRLGHATSAMRKKSWRNIRQDPRQPTKSRALPNREPYEDQLEDSNVAGEHYRERYRNPPRRAPEREPETSSWQRFPEQEIDRYFVEPSPEADGEPEDAERSNFDHEPDRAPWRRLSLEPEETFETIPPDGRYARERGGPVSHRYEFRAGKSDRT